VLKAIAPTRPRQMSPHNLYFPLIIRPPSRPIILFTSVS
jgi:hypothetical protein